MSSILLLEGPDGNRYTAFPYFDGWVVNPFSPLSLVTLREESQWWGDCTANFHYGEPIVFKSLREFTVLAASPGNYNAHSISFY